MALAVKEASPAPLLLSQGDQIAAHQRSGSNDSGLESAAFVEDSPETGNVGWIAAGFTLFVFSAPSAVQSAPFFVGGTGLLGSILICILVTFGSMSGSWMLLQVKLTFPSATSFGDLGFRVCGRKGKIIGNLLQLSNFLLFLPCALRFTGQALAGIGYGIPAFNPEEGPPCWDYYIFVIAAVCFMTMQLRTLSNTAIFAIISSISVLIMGIVQLVVAFTYDVEDKQPALWFGNPHSNERNESVILMLRAAGISVFGYVPSFVTAEMATCMKDPQEMTKSLAFSGVLNVAMMLGVGIPVVSSWGYNMGYVAPLTGQFAGPGTAKVAAWNAGNAATTVLQIFALMGNFVSYMLDSVPLGRYCQKAWAPRYEDSWSISDIRRYMMYTLPAFFFGLLMAVFFPSLDFLIDVVTFATVPWVTMVFPAVLYWNLLSQGRVHGRSAGQPMKLVEKLFILGVMTIGISGFLISFFGFVGELALNGVADWEIG